jgi:hypothetical protein
MGLNTCALPEAADRCVLKFPIDPTPFERLVREMSRPWLKVMDSRSGQVIHEISYSVIFVEVAHLDVFFKWIDFSCFAADMAYPGSSANITVEFAHVHFSSLPHFRIVLIGDPAPVSGILLDTLLAMPV